MTTTTNKVTLGLIKGRHENINELATDGFLVDTVIDDIFDFDGVKTIIKANLHKVVGIEGATARIGTWDGDVRANVNVIDRDIDILVTGLTSVAIAAMDVLRDLDFNGHTVRFMHFDKDTKGFHAQVIKPVTVPVFD